MVSILEPFIDTIVICTITGLVILSSGVWSEKFENRFEESSMCFLNQNLSDNSPSDVNKLRAYIYSCSGSLAMDSELEVQSGQIINADFTLMHNRSVAENFIVYGSANNLYEGKLSIVSGKLNDTDVYIEGSSLLIGADLTGKAFTRSIFGEYGQYIVAIGLLLFAFSTAIAWSYYGDRATVHLFGEYWVFHYRVIYVGAFFLASIIDTKIVWDIATVIGPIATVPNLIAILLLRREIKEIQAKYIDY